LRLILLAVLALAALWLSGMPFFFEEVRLLSGSGRSSGAYRLATWGNTLIAASAALYMANRYLSVDAVGRWATRLAGAGAAVLVADIGAAPLGLAPELPVVYHAPVLQYHEAISVMAPMAVSRGCGWRACRHCTARFFTCSSPTSCRARAWHG
jgi:hypothetical protein